MASQVFKVSEDKVHNLYLQPLLQAHPDQKLQSIRSNMELPETLKFRHNTKNKEYGFEQTLHKPVQHVPTRAATFLPEGDFPYSYAVAGNYQK